jgi:ribosome-binding factor A
MPSQQRLKRIADRIKEELSEMILMHINDPRLQGVYITDVQVDRELAYASIYVSAIEGQERAKEILEGFSHASGFLRRQLAKNIDLRVFPRLRFFWDPTPERAEHIEHLLDTINDESSPSEADTDE